MICLCWIQTYSLGQFCFLESCANKFHRGVIHAYSAEVLGNRIEDVIVLTVFFFSAFLCKVQPLVQKSVPTLLKVTVCQMDWNELNKLKSVCHCVCY
jgi:hypothetical protein